jgi:tripartite-type tricarboxylate transporter receptor subunit TctC
VEAALKLYRTWENHAMTRFTTLLVSLLAALATLLGGAASAQTYPTGRVTMLVVTAAGGPLDAAARLLAEQLQARFGQPFIVENRPGGGSRIAIDALRATPADGHTLLVAGGSITTLSVFVKGVDFDTLRDLAPVTISAEFAALLAVNKDVPATTLREFIDYAKSRGGKVNYGSVGRQPTLLAMEGFQQLAGFKMTEVPFKTAAEYLTAMLRNDIQIATITEAQARPHLATGALKLLAVLGDRRLKSLPDVPSTAELGFPEFRLPGWVAVLANRGTPASTVDRLHQGISATLKQPQVAAQFEKLGLIVLDLSPEQTRQRIGSETQFWTKVANQIGLKPE